MREISKEELLFELTSLTSNNPNNILFDMDDIDSMTCEVSKIYSMQFSVSASTIAAFQEAIQPFKHRVKSALCHFKITENHDLSNVISIMDKLQQGLEDETDILFSTSYGDDQLYSNMMMTVFVVTRDKLIPINNVYKR